MTPIAFSIIWSASLAAAIAWYFSNHGWPLDIALLRAVLPYAIGALFGGWLALKFAASRNKVLRPTARFSLFFITLSIFTLGITTLIFVSQALLYHSQGHADIGSMMRVYQTFFTGLGSVFLMAITGLRPLLPWGIILLFFASLCFSRGWLSSSR
ncbi:MAG: hypothetical protein V3V02_08045 [Rhizobiaceae bacterium]